MNDATKPRSTLSKRDRGLALVLCIATVALFLFLRTPDSDEMETKQIADLSPLVELAQPAEAAWSEAALQYRSGLYNVAATKYQTLSRSGPDTRRAQLFWGSCQLQSQRFDAAELTLRPLLTAGPLDSVEAAARWLLAQVYLSRDESEPAADELLRLADDLAWGARAREQSAALQAMYQDQ